jgi:hypothetical protein
MHSKTVLALGATTQLTAKNQKQDKKRIEKKSKNF